MSYNLHDDQKDILLWRDMKAGSIKAFEELYDGYFSVLYGYGLQFCPERAVIQDCLQDFFVDLYQKRHRLSEVNKVKQYLFVSFRHCIVRHISGKRRMLESINEQYQFQTTFSPEQSLIGEQLDEYRQEQLKKSFRKLSSRQREAVFLRYYENMSYAEIAEVMKLKEVKYARTLIYRAIVSLRDSLKGHSLTLYTTLPFLFFLPRDYFSAISNR